MIIALTGTPGTGKTSVAKDLEKKGYKVVDLNAFSSEKNFFEGYDKKRDSKIIDIDKVNSYLKKNNSSERICILDSHLSHLIECVDKVFLLRCYPEKLKKRLKKKNWKPEKVDENLEAEMLDVILCESLDVHDKKNVFEIDTSELKTDDVAEIIDDIIKNDFKSNEAYTPGGVDWSEELLKRKKN